MVETNSVNPVQQGAEGLTDSPHFSPDFVKMGEEAVCRELEEHGFIVISEATRSEAMNSLLREVNSTGPGFNHNGVTPVRYYNQTFFSNAMAGSPTVAGLLTDPFLFRISHAQLGEDFRLKCHRYYESGYLYQLGWHTDNKTVDNRKTMVKGIVFVLYLEDTFDGELMVVRGSHRWSDQSPQNAYSDEEIAKNHGKDVVSIPGKAGTLVIFNTRTIHRTKKITKRGYVRKSLFFQIDDDMAHSERTLVNPEYIRSMSPQIARYLGFGLPSGYECVPLSGVHTLGNADLVRLWRQTGVLLFKRLCLGVKVRLKGLVGKNES
jgi:hypothetical protein